MSLPTFNEYSLQSDTILTEHITYRTRAKRGIELAQIARRSGKKMIADLLEHKTIVLTGHIVCASPTELQTTIDEFMQNVSGVQGSLVIESGRTYTATAERVEIPDRSYNNSSVPFEIQFVVPDGYAEASGKQAYAYVTSGTQTRNIDVTISGNMPNRPSIRVSLPGSAGISPTRRIDITEGQFGYTQTASGVWNRGDAILFDYNLYKVTKNGTEIDFIGQMPELNPGSTTFTIALSGTAPQEGALVRFLHSPRYP